MLTFAVVTAGPGRPLPPWVGTLVDDPAPPQLTFRPAAHVSWASDDGRVRVAAWQDADRLGIGRRWDVRPEGITAFAGFLWHRATPWSGSVPWAAQLADLLTQTPLADAAPDIDGSYAALSVSGSGNGAVTSDPLGSTSLYRAERDGVVAASNRASVAARLVTPPGLEPARDPEAMAWLILSGAVQSGRTGFESVRRVPEGSYLALGPGRALDVVTWDPRPWWAGPPASPDDHAALITEAADAIEAQLRIHAALPSARRTMELTGGHDSRLLLALGLRAGVQHCFSYETWGSAELPDVVVAGCLAERYQLDHTATGQQRPERQPPALDGPAAREPHPDPDLFNRPSLSFEASIRHHVWATSGGLSAWDRTYPCAPPRGSIHVSGLYGELLRPRNPGSAGFADEQAALRALEAGWLRLDPAGLLHPDLRRDLLRRVVEHVAEARGPGGTVQDGFDGNYLRHRLRPWHGGIGEHDQRNRVYPFLARRAVQAAFAMGPGARHQEILAFTIVNQVDPALARHEFAAAGWAEGAVRGVDDPGSYPTTFVGSRWRPDRSPRQVVRRAIRNAAHTVRLRSRPQREISVREEARMASFAEELPQLASLVDLGPGHALFDLVDRRAVERALRRGDHAYANRRAVFDLATAAVWLDDGEVKAS